MKRSSLFLFSLLAFVASVLATGPPAQADSANSALAVCDSVTSNMYADADNLICEINADSVITCWFDTEPAIFLSLSTVIQPTSQSTALALTIWGPPATAVAIRVLGSPKTGFIHTEDAAKQTLLATADNRNVMGLFIEI